LKKSYEEFLASKLDLQRFRGFEINPSEVNPLLKPHQRDIVCWAVHKGCAAIFAAFGLGKSFMQLEVARLITAKAGGKFLIVAPLGVRQEFKRDAEKLGIELKFIRRVEETECGYCGGTGEVACSSTNYMSCPDCKDRKDPIYITNYETIRDGKLDPRLFTGVSLDEASILRGFGGTKTFREFMRVFENQQVKYKFVATATPSPNEYIELLAYAAFLDVMDVGQAKTRFFKRDSTKADSLTLHPHKEREFWLWMSTWAIFLQKPSDLGYSDEGYELPELDVHWHEVASSNTEAGYENSGQAKLVKASAIDLRGAAKEKRESLDARIDKLLELRALDPQSHRIIWHDLEAERGAIEKAIPDVTSVYGSQDLEEREQCIADFSDGKISELAAKPVIAGSGCNFQRYCNWAIFLGIGFKFNDFIQACHRVHRFLQTKRVRIDLIYTEAEREVRRVLEQKWAQHKELVANMTEIIREYGLAHNALHQELRRNVFNPEDRVEITGKNFLVANNDSVYETRSMDSDSVHLILTSIPFSTQYEYTPSYSDFGHTDSNDHFFAQMDYLTPELFRVLKPGRVAAIHVKDRIVPGGLTGRGYQTVYRFSDKVCDHFEKHGFGFLGRKTIVTDVVRENNQTYRLGWSEQCKDGSRMGVGMAEYLLYFRKDPTDTSNGYADDKVVKDKLNYSRSRWQIDAHGFARSSGNRLLMPVDFEGVPHERIFKMFRKYSLEHVYDYKHHIELSESLERCQSCGHIHTEKSCLICGCQDNGGRLPVTFMLLQPQSWHPDVWTDVTRMRTLNGAQSAKGKEMHLCPLQFDIVDRVIEQFSMPGETVYDPFGGIMTVPYCAVKLNRFGRASELKHSYFLDGAQYCSAAEKEASVPTLFDVIETQEEEMVAL
jgi:DNA modification methylase